MKLAFPITLLAAALMLSACTESSTSTTASSNTAGNEQAAGGDAASLPDGLFVADVSGEAVPLVDVKTSATEGDRITFEARIGGRKSPFVENRAVFFVTDSSIPSCADLHGDTCATPWDYCCEPADNLLAHMATVQIVDDEGHALKTSLESVEGLVPLKTVVITGTVSQIDEGGTFVVNAESIHVKES